MDADGRNPAFPRAIPHGMLFFGLLLRVLLFGSLPGSQKEARMGPKKDTPTFEPRNYDPQTRIRNSSSNSIVALEAEVEFKLVRQA